MYIIRYEVKVTVSNNTYYTIEKADRDWLIAKLVQVQSYMCELSVTKNDDLKSFVKWYNSPNKTLPISTQFKRHNSPNSFVAGTINNILYGNQNDITDTQSAHLQFIINSFTDLASEANITLQRNADNQPISFQPNIWGTL